ncbi:MAG: hypothetical protein IJC64_03295 [Clostridia bacterium]|nr:hypothetical protein [Clostridia bacterium]
MYVRPPSPATRIKLPENYGGNAFSGGAYGDMPPPIRQSSPPPRDTPKSEIPAKSSPLANSLRETGQASPSAPQEQYDEPLLPEGHIAANEKPTNEQKEKEPEPKSSIFSSLLPRSLNANGFPFGHGIGTEELLILGIMLLVYLSGNDTGDTDSELILLLGLLLFAG